MYNRGDVLLIPVPFTDLTATKKRPVLVVSNNDYNAGEDVIVAAITSNLARGGLSITNADMAAGALPKPSIILPGKVYTLNQSIAVKRVGLASADITDRAAREITRLLDVPPGASLAG